MNFGAGSLPAAWPLALIPDRQFTDTIRDPKDPMQLFVFLTHWNVQDNICCCFKLQIISHCITYYWCDKTPWLRQLLEERVYLGLWFKIVGVHDGGDTKAAVADKEARAESWKDLKPQVRGRENELEIVHYFQNFKNLSQGHIFSNKAILPNLMQTVPLTGTKHSNSSLWETYSFSGIYSLSFRINTV